MESERLEYHKGDIFAVPTWKWHYHENTRNDDAILFSIDDWPAMKKLGFYMKQAHFFPYRCFGTTPAPCDIIRPRFLLRRSPCLIPSSAFISVSRP
jgi:hypothetical protein